MSDEDENGALECLGDLVCFLFILFGIMVFADVVVLLATGTDFLGYKWDIGSPDLSPGYMGD